MMESYEDSIFVAVASAEGGLAAVVRAASHTMLAVVACFEELSLKRVCLSGMTCRFSPFLV